MLKKSARLFQTSCPKFLEALRSANERASEAFTIDNRMLYLSGLMNEQQNRNFIKTDLGSGCGEYRSKVEQECQSLIHKLKLKQAEFQRERDMLECCLPEIRTWVHTVTQIAASEEVQKEARMYIKLMDSKISALQKSINWMEERLDWIREPDLEQKVQCSNQ